MPSRDTVTCCTSRVLAAATTTWALPALSSRTAVWSVDVLNEASSNWGPRLIAGGRPFHGAGGSCAHPNIHNVNPTRPKRAGALRYEERFKVAGYLLLENKARAKNRLRASGGLPRRRVDRKCYAVTMPAPIYRAALEPATWQPAAYPMAPGKVNWVGKQAGVPQKLGQVGPGFQFFTFSPQPEKSPPNTRRPVAG